MRRILLVLTAASLLAAGAGHVQAATLPSHQTPNGPGDIIVPFALSTPPPVPEQRSYAQLLTLWQSAGSAYGVPWEVLGAINKIETNFGRNMGPSSAGAVGWMQFMPSTWARWGLDANGDGVANPWNPEDAVYAAARYLAAAGAHEDIERAIFAYNHAGWYVRDVLELAQVFAAGGGFDPSLGSSFAPSLGASGPGAVFRADDIEKRLAKARRVVNREQRDVLRVERNVQDLDTQILEAQQRAGDPSLSDLEFQAVEEEVTLLVLEQERAVAAVARERAELDEAAALVETLRQEASAITFSRPVSNGLGQAQFAGDYVFPVGGGPEVVSVSRTHHDYPAADIAAPEGAPLYALADSFVTRTYPTPAGRCGIGFELQLENGQHYLYCHLSYLETHVVPGAALSAGTPVGLVGSTGNSTGPHLHLQFVPVTTYPQAEPWFQAFAGVAFRWAGEAAPTAAPAPARAVFEPASAPVIEFSSDPVVGFTS
jgi:murein DD-endopeptidase MepM/ murein hydrolase activator NlpD